MSSETGAGPLAVDLMGADLGTEEVIEAVALALKEFPDVQKLLLVGDEALVRPLLRTHGLDGDSRLEIIHASEVITMDDKPIQSLKRKKDSSLVRAVEMVKEKRAGGVLSCGNTGALMAAGTLKIRPEIGVERPALGVVLPSRDHHSIMVDAGANPESEPLHLVHNAILGSYYCSALFERDKPVVGLLTIGTEEGKGTERIHETHRYLKELGEKGIINYRGLIEGFHVFEKEVDVVVCDGFVGNILLKTAESLFYSLKEYLKSELTRNPIRTLGAFLCKGAFQDMKKQLSPDQYGGAQLLGLGGMVMKAHGSSNRYAIRSAIGIACRLLKHDLAEQVRNDIEQANNIVKAQSENKATADPT